MVKGSAWWGDTERYGMLSRRDYQAGGRVSDYLRVVGVRDERSFWYLGQSAEIVVVTGT